MREPDEPDNLNDQVREPNPRRRPDTTSPDRFHVDPDLQATEAAWGRLRPSAPQFDRDQLMYQAGWAAAETALTQQRRRRPMRLAWPVALVGMTAVAATLLGMLLVRPEPGIVERVVYVEREAEEVSTDAARAFAQSNAGASAADVTASGVWTAGQWLRAAADSSQLASDLLPAEIASWPTSLPSIAEPVVLSSRSFDLLLNDHDRGSSKLTLPDCQTPHALEPTHDL